MHSKEEFRENNLVKWEKKLKEIFYSETPRKYEWTDISEIIKILNKIGENNLNHAFLPTGGGKDISGADFADEDGCIKLFSGRDYDIVKPKKLMFNSFKGSFEWDYFRLEIEELEPSGVYDIDDLEYEELVCLSNGRYIDREFWDMGYYYDEYENRKEFSMEDAVVDRFIKSGSFVIFAKGSIYNRVSGTYDARHNKMSNEEFREYIQRSIDKYKKTAKA